MTTPRPKLRHVLLDASFLDALLAADDPDHETARTLYTELIDGYANRRDLLHALSTVLDQIPSDLRRSALAPVGRVHVAAQHLSAAGQISNIDPQAALALVMMQRERIGTIATTSHSFDLVDVEVISPSLNSRTAPQPVPRSTAE